MKEIFKSLATTSSRLGRIEKKGGRLFLKTGPLPVEIRKLTKKEIDRFDIETYTLQQALEQLRQALPPH